MCTKFIIQTHFSFFKSKPNPNHLDISNDKFQIFQRIKNHDHMYTSCHVIARETIFLYQGFILFYFFLPTMWYGKFGEYFFQKIEK
jgi:hypothetical protein